jgi:hypothetical protein
LSKYIYLDDDIKLKLMKKLNDIRRSM